MAQFRPKLKPGINKLDTETANEGGFSDGNLVRFYQGKWQPVGGWTIKSSELGDSVARGAHTWVSKDLVPIAAYGTSEGLYALVGGALQDITPKLHETVLENIFTTENGSATVTAHIPYHGLNVSDSFTFSNHQTTVGGLTIEGTFTVTAVPTINTFEFTFTSNATSDVTTAAGGFVDFSAPLPDGEESTPAGGYSTGGYSTGGYSAAGSSATEARVWSLDNYGENLAANPTGYGLFEWQPERTYADLAFNGDFASGSDGWGLGTGWAVAAGKATKTAGTASNLSQNVLDIAEGGRVYRVTFTVSGRTAGSVKFRVNAGTVPAVIDVDTASSAITKNGTYSRLFVCPAEPSDFVFEADSSFNGSIDDVSYAVESKAYRVTQAPWRMDAMFVDPHGVVVAVGSSTIDGDYNPICVRNSDQGNLRDWTPDSASTAAENFLRGGGRLMCGLATREQNLIWGDAGVFSFQWNSSPLDGNAFTANLLGTNCGIISRHAMAEHNGFVKWASNTKQFFIFRGIGATNLGAPERIVSTVADEVFDNMDTSQTVKCCAGINPEFDEFWFFYPDSRDGSENSRAVSVAWTDPSLPWATHQIVRTAWAGGGEFDGPIGMGIYNGKTLIFQHETGKTANGSALGWFVETSFFDIEEGDNIMHLKEYRQDFKNMVGGVTMTITGRMYPNGANTGTKTINCTTSTVKHDFRITARQMKIKYAENGTGSFARVGAEAFEIRKTGARR